MRRVLFLGLPLLVILCGGLGWYVVAHRADLLADAQARLARGDLHGAEVDLDSFLRRHPGSAVGEYRLGLIELGLDNPVAAARELRQAQAHGYDAKAIIMPLGQTYMRQQLYDQALTDFDPDKAPPGGRAETLAFRAQVFLALNKIDDAGQAAEAAEAAAPDAPAPLVAAGRVELARNDFALAQVKADRALALDPRNVDALLLRSDVALRRSDAKTALRFAQTVLAANPSDLNAKMAAARAYAGLGDAADAIPLLDQVSRAERRDSAPRFLRAILADRAHDFATANANLEAISSVIDDIPQGNYYLGVTKLGLGQFGQAQEAAAKFHARSPDDADGTRLLALTELSLNQPQEAQKLVSGLVASGHTDPETLDLLGRSQAMAGDMKAAEVSLARSAASNPKNVDVLNRLAAVRLRLGKDREAIADLQHSLDLKPGQDDAGVTWVQAALALGDVNSAADAVVRLRQAHGETPLTGMLNATVLAARQDLSGAEVAYRAVLARYPQTKANEEALRQTTLGLVETLGKLGQVQAVQDALTAWVQKNPTDVQSLGLLLKLLFADGKPDQAVAVASAAHDGAPSNVGLTEMLARAYVAAHKLDRAAALLDRAGAGINPKLAQLRAETLAMAGKPAEARTAYANLLQLAPADVAARLGLVQLDMQGKDYDAARETIREGLKQTPGNAQLMQALVGLDLKAGGLKAALATADALAAEPANLPGALLLRSAAYGAAGDKAGAADAAVAAFRQAPSTQLAISAWNALNQAGRSAEAEKLLTDWAGTHPADIQVQQVLGAVALADRRTDDAAAHLQIVLAALPNDPGALNNMALVLLARGDVGQARNFAQRAYFIQSGPQTADTLAWVLVKQGNAAQAVPLLRSAIAASPLPGVAYHYAVALNDTGQRDAAKAVLQKLVSGPERFGERDDATRLLDALSK